MSVLEWQREVTRDTSLSTTARLVAVGVSLHTNWKTGVGAWPSKATLAEELGVSVDTIRRSLKDLVEAGWLEAAPRSGQTTIYNTSTPGTGAGGGASATPCSDAPPAPVPPPAPMQGGASTGATPPPAPVLPNPPIDPPQEPPKENGEGERTFLERAREIMERAEPPDYTPRTPRRAGDDCPEVQAFEREIDRLKEEEDGLVGHLTRLVETHQDAIKLYTRRKDRAALTASKLEVIVSTLRFYDRPADEVRGWLTHKVGELVSREVGLHIWHKALTNYEDMRCWVEDQRERRKRRPEERPIEYLKDPFDVSHLL